MGLLTPLAVRIGGISWMPRLLPQVVWLDRGVQRVTHGRLSLLDVAGLPNLVLTVTGRRSGLPRSTPLLCAPRGRTVLVAGSNFGGPHEPLWVKNLEADPRATIRYEGATRSVTARRLEGDERAAAWAELLAVWPNFGRYEQRTERLIKVYELVPDPVPAA